MHPPDDTRRPLDRSAKAVISQVLADSVTPLLKRHGFDRRGRRMYDRARNGRRELINIENEWNNRYGGSITINLGIFIPEVDSIVSLYPLQAPPEEDEWHIRCRIGDVGPDGRIREDPGAEARKGWWEFDAQTDLSAFGADVRQSVEHNALGFFDNMSTKAGILAWVRRYPTAWWHKVVLPAYVGEPTVAQEALDKVVAADSPGPNQTLRTAARIASRLGLACPAPTDVPALTAVFRVAADTPPQDRYRAFHHLDHKFRQYVGLLRDLLPVHDPAQLYHFAECEGLACTVTFYGADPEDMLGSLRRAFARLSETFADITWQTNPEPPTDGR
jgi:Domain of unknown function (DUF4304)